MSAPFPSADLLPATFRRALLIRRRIIAWGTVAVLLLCAVGGACLWEYRTATKLQQIVSQHQQRAAPILAIREQSRERTAEVEKLRTINSRLELVEPHHDPVRLLLLIAACREPAAAAVVVKNFDYRTERTPESEKSKPTEPLIIPDHERHLVLNGEAGDQPALDRFLDRMRRMGLFQRVELKSATGSSRQTPNHPDDRTALQFHVRLTY